MATAISPAGDDVIQVLDDIKRKHHARIIDASVAVLFKAVKPFTGDGRFNFGQVKKFTPSAKIWHHPNRVYDFEITIPEDSWHVILTPHQREALLDLHLTRCTAEFVPLEVEKNGKRKKAKDQWGRLQFTDQIRLDEATGLPIWKVLPLDIMVLAENARRYGLWHDDLRYLGDAVVHAPKVDGCADIYPTTGSESDASDISSIEVEIQGKTYVVNPDADRSLDGAGMED